MDPPTTNKPFKKSAIRYPQTPPQELVPHGRDPSVPSTIPVATASSPNYDQDYETEKKKKSFKDFVYNKETKEYCGRTCSSWCSILLYTIMYVIFLATYTLVFLYCSLLVLKSTTDYKTIDKVELLTYSEHGVGLTVVPTSETNQPLISYKSGNSKDYDKYVTALDRFLNKAGRDLKDLGPCGKQPYGYGDKPCVVIKITKQFNWAGAPLRQNSTLLNSAPSEVQKWTRRDKNKLWLQCHGYHDYDKEHIKELKYYPDPPGFDPNIFPLDKDSHSPIIAVQFLRFTVGVSIAIECQLWYDTGPSKVDFMLYVEPEEKT